MGDYRVAAIQQTHVVWGKVIVMKMMIVREAWCVEVTIVIQASSIRDPIVVKNRASTYLLHAILTNMLEQNTI